MDIEMYSQRDGHDLHIKRSFLPYKEGLNTARNGMWKKSVVTLSEVVLRQLPGAMRKSTKKFIQDAGSRARFESETSRTQSRGGTHSTATFGRI